MGQSWHLLSQGDQGLGQQMLGSGSVGKEGASAAFPFPGWKECSEESRALVGMGRLLFSMVEGGQTVILIFQAASFAKLAPPAPAGMENCTGWPPPPPLC